MKFAVLGGTGMMGRIAVRDLFESGPRNEVILAGTDMDRSERAAAAYGSPRVSPARVDVRDRRSLSLVLRDCDVAVNCVQYEHNLQVMEGALAAGAHYVDLGGLYYTTLKQLKLDGKFRKAGLSAVLGMGSTPGITNVLAASGSEGLDRIHSIDVKFGAADFSRYEGRPFPVPYSISTLIDEFTLPPVVFRNGKIVKEKPLGGIESVRFPPPVGRKTAFYTLHSELATFPASFGSKGVRNVSFRVSFERDFVEKILFLADTGMSSERPVDFGGKRMVPREFLAKVLSLRKKPKVKKLEDYECLMVELSGWKKGKRKKARIACLARSSARWGVPAGDVDTGTPPSIVAQMQARGALGPGAYPPEFHVPAGPFFEELQKRGMRIIR